MDCRDIKQHIDAYWDRELSPDVSARVRNHLSQCPACHAEYGMVSDLLTSHEPPAVPSGLRDRVFDAVVRAKEDSSQASPQRTVLKIASKRGGVERPVPRNRLVPLAWGGALAACIAMLLISRPHSPAPRPMASDPSERFEAAVLNPLSVPSLLFAAMQPGQLSLAGAAVAQVAALEQVTQSTTGRPVRLNRRPLREDYVPLQDDHGMPLPAVMSAVSRTLGA